MTVSPTKKLSIRLLQAHTDSGTGTVNEDTWGQAGNALWVIDGATGCGPHYSQGESDAFLFTQILNETLKVHFLEDNTSTTQETLEKVIKETRDKFLYSIGKQSIPHSHQPSAAFAMVRFINPELEVTVLGDCKVRIEQDGVAVDALCDQRILPFETRTLDKAKHLRQQHPNASNDEIRRMLMPTIQKNRASMNTENGYWVMSFEPAAANQALVSSLNLQNQSTNISLSSDGFDRLSDLYGEKLPQLSSLRDEPEKIEPLFQRLRTIEQADQECSKYLRAKTHDDATFVLAAIN